MPLGDFLVTAYNLSLAASENGTLTAPDTTNQIALRLGNSGTILGEVVRADGVTPVSGEDILIEFTSQSSNPGRAVYHTGDDGKFQFNNVPVGPVHLSSAAPDFGGLINLFVTLTNNGDILDLGIIPYDEILPEVVMINPTNGTIGVPITNSIYLLFNKALDTNTINLGGFLLNSTNGAVPTTVSILADTNGVFDLVDITPKSPLHSLQTYQVVVLAGDLVGALGSFDRHRSQRSRWTPARDAIRLFISSRRTIPRRNCSRCSRRTTPFKLIRVQYRASSSTNR